MDQLIDGTLKQKLAATLFPFGTPNLDRKHVGSGFANAILSRRSFVSAGIIAELRTRPRFVGAFDTPHLRHSKCDEA